MSSFLKKISLISKLHYLKLALRSLLFIAALMAYVLSRVQGSPAMFGGYEDSDWLWRLITLVFAVEMVLRFFPSNYESMGCQKQFANNYIPGQDFDRQELLADSWKQTVPVMLSWFALNGAIGALYYYGIIDWGVLVLISIAYSVCDMICILFFCPFQTWMMKNKCCGTCRIYNWDYAMMFTPLLLIDNVYAHILVGLSLLLLLRWELNFHFHPERFYEKTNKCLSCANCPEKLCHHKKQLQQFQRMLLKKGIKFR